MTKPGVPPVSFPPVSFPPVSFPPFSAPPISFVDTNVLVYAFAPDDAVRSPIAIQLVEELMASNTFRTSTQVLQELFVTLTRTGGKTIGADLALHFVDQIAAFQTVTNDYSIIRAGAELSSRHKLSFWDALIVAAAARSGATRLYSEDLQHGRKILGVEVVNPFRRS